MRKIEINNLQKPPVNKRDNYPKLQDYMVNSDVSRGNVFIIYGLRRTGKTTMMEQYICSHPEESVAYYIAENGDTMDGLIRAIDAERQNGTKSIFVDEFTKVVDFSDNASVLADVYAKYGMKIVLTGTDSLRFRLADSELFGRKLGISTTHVFFAEHARIFGTNDIDDYIRYGGLMKEGEHKRYVEDYESACKYLDEAVSANIANSLESGEFNELLEFSKDELDLIIRKTVEQYSGHFDLKRLQTQLKRASVYEPIKTLADMAKKGKVELDYDLLVPLLKDQREEIAEAFLAKINADKALTHKLELSHLNKLEYLLVSMGALSVVQVKTFQKDGGNWISSGTSQEYYVIQPAIKYYQLLEGVAFLGEEAYFSSLGSNAVLFLQNKLKEQIFGKMTEQIVLYDTSCDLCGEGTDIPRYRVFKPEFKRAMDNEKNAEYDMLIQDTQDGCYWGFEIKYSSVVDKEQQKHLLNEEIRNLLDENFGERRNVSVLYRGDPFLSSTGTYYLNIADFLISIHKTRDIEKTMSELTRGLVV